MKTVTIEVSEKMFAAIEAFSATWTDLNKKQVLQALLKTGIEIHIMDAGRILPEDYEKIKAVMSERGFEINIQDMDVYKYPFKDRRY
ncbi:MAG TPA: hypothetical protein VIK14_12180 [Ignavibacteria bacterium]